MHRTCAIIGLCALALVIAIAVTTCMIAQPPTEASFNQGRLENAEGATGSGKAEDTGRWNKTVLDIPLSLGLTRFICRAQIDRFE
jgi:hypothetical protein